MAQSTGYLPVRAGSRRRQCSAVRPALDVKLVVGLEILNVCVAVIADRHDSAGGPQGAGAAERHRNPGLIDQSQQCAMAEFDRELDHYARAILGPYLARSDA